MHVCVPCHSSDCCFYLTAHAPSPAPEESPERDPGPPLANCSFIITSGQEKEKTFDRDYIAKKVVELGGAVLNTFEELTQVRNIT